MIRTSDHNGDAHEAVALAISTDNEGVEFDKIAPISKGILAAKLVDGEYQQVSLRLVGSALMHDTEKRSRIRVTKEFKDTFIIGIQEGKGCEIKGLNIKGNNTRTDDRNPATCIKIDPHHTQSKGGSTGITIDNCTTSDMQGGIVFSPNGYTQNCEMMTIQNHRFQHGEFGFAGCQSQEKNNRITNVECWGNTELLFNFSDFGAGSAGHYVIDGVNIAGNVNSLVKRASGGWFPLIMKNVYAENLQSIGHWSTSIGDSMSDSSINFRHPKYDGFPATHLTGYGVTFNNCDFRYFGYKYPVVMASQNNVYNNCRFEGGFLTGWYSSLPVIDRVIAADFIKTKKEFFKTGDLVVFSTLGNNGYAGMAEVTDTSGTLCNLRYLTKTLSGTYNISKYINEKPLTGIPPIAGL